MSSSLEEQPTMSREEKIALLDKLQEVLTYKGWFDYISLIIDKDTDAYGKLKMILNDFHIFYDEELVNLETFLDNKIFSILKSFYDLASVNYRDPTIVNDEYRNRIKSFVEELINLDPAIPYELEFRLVYELKGRVQIVKNELKEYREDAERVHKLLEEREQKWQLSSFAGSFDKIANNESCYKFLWGFLTFISGFFATIFIVESSILMIENNFNLPLVEYLQKLSNTILLFFVSYWCSKRYLLCRSEEIFYRHIAYALNSYNIFKDSIDKEEKRIIITEMAHTVFSLPILPNMKTVENSDWTKILDIINLVKQKADG